MKDFKKTQENAKKIYRQMEIIKNDAISTDVYDMILNSGEIAKLAHPGQFVNIYLDKGEMILPRPISICEADSETGNIRLVYRIVGKGTIELSRKKSGEALKILAPLGNVFPISDELKNVAVVGGGIGVPPMLFLAKELKKTDTKPVAILGFRDEPILLSDFEKYGIETHIATDNGNIGFKGNVVGLLENLEKLEKFDAVYGCGPNIMLKNLAKWADNKNIPCYISLEERMGCGFGVCVGCVCRTNDSNGNTSYKKVCTDGPVFNSTEVVFP